VIMMFRPVSGASTTRPSPMYMPTWPGLVGVSPGAAWAVA
jgi:hypothetical protein